jgi:enterochelin esterase-like enzyme
MIFFLYFGEICFFSCELYIMIRYFLVLVLTCNLFAQSEFNSFIAYVNSLGDSQLKTAAVDSFMTYARSKGIPFIEGNTANFIYRGTKNTVQIAGDFTSWSPSVTMSKIGGTDFFYSSRNFELNARLDYKLVTDGTWILDPENPKKVSGGFGPNSELAMPEYVQPWEIIPDISVPKGTTTFGAFSTSTNVTYSIAVYLPPDYDSSLASGYPSVYFQDGYEYIYLGSAPVIFDNLIHTNRIEKVIGIFVKPNNREQDFAASNRDAYRLFFVNELVPYIDSLYNTAAIASKRAVIGDSWGGNISALISGNHPDVFGNCGLHSGALMSNNYEAFNLIIDGPVKDIKFASVWGTYESLFTHMRSFRDSIMNRGYSVRWKELPEGHSWGLWRAETDYMIEYFFPGSAASTGKDFNYLNKNFKLYQNYPNPFNPETEINFTLNISSPVILRVYDSLGSEVTTLVNNELGAGDYKASFNGNALSSGVYYYRLNTDNSAETRKMILLK